MTFFILAHLWQSTLFGLAAAAVAGMLHRHRAGVRFGVWLAASLKFLVPFAVLVKLGSHLRWPAAAASGLGDKFVATLGGPVVAFAALPLRHGAGAPAAQAASAVSAGPGWLWALAAVWAGGASLILCSRLRAWRRLQRLLRSSVPLGGDAGLAVRTSQGELEPGVLGWRHPVLLLPQGIATRLSAAELAAVLAHERNHLRRRDNLWSVLHMLVETLFWFYPMVWWIGARLLRERERACDEAVLSQGHAGAVYAGAILNVCRHYAESPLSCVAGITGADLRDRVEGIVRGRVGRRLGHGAAALLAAAATLALALPILAGVGRAQPVARLVRLFTVPIRIPSVAAQLHAVAPVAAPAPAVVPVLTPQQAPLQLQAPPDRRLIVFYFDLSTMAAKDVDNAVQSAENYVDKQLTPNSMVSIASLGTGLSVLQDFTADPARLHAVLEGVAGRGGGASGAGASSFVADDSGSSADRSLQALATMCQMLEPIQQKKSILFFSDGIARQGGDNALTLRSAVNACVKANVSIYSIDARGLVLQVPEAPASSATGDDAAPRGEVTINVSGATCSSCASPRYPDIARHAHLQGEVVLMVAIGTDGKVLNEGIEGSPNVLLAGAARSAVSDWTFQAPTTPSNAKVTVTFQLETQ